MREEEEDEEEDEEEEEEEEEEEKDRQLNDLENHQFTYTDEPQPYLNELG